MIIFFIFKEKGVFKKKKKFIIGRDPDQTAFRLEEERWRFKVFMEENANINEIISIMEQETCANED